MRVTTLFLAFISLLSADSLPPTERPNILFIFSDDQSWDTLGTIGGEVKTPNLDRLVQSGVFFQNAYNSGAWQGAVCMASRTMLMTGRQLWQAHRFHQTKERDPAAFWSGLFREAGYRTYFAGKWHVSNCKPSSIYDVTGVVRPGMPNYFDPALGGRYKWNERGAGYFRPTSEADDSWDPSDPIYGGFWEGGRHWSEVTGDDGVAFIESAAGSEEPFFMQIAFNAPHDPRQSPRSFLDQYPLDEVALPENFLAEQPHAIAMEVAEGMTRDEDLGPFPRTPYSVRKNRQEYFALITHMDVQIGRILDALEASGLMEQTIIVYTSDHGLACGQHGLMGKQNLYEHSVKPPLILCGGGLPAGEQIDTPVYMQDLMPTTLEMAGIPIPEDVAFKSLLPVVAGEISYPAIYGAYKDKQRMIRVGKMKLIVYPQSATRLLFDLEEDPREMKNLAEDPAYQSVLVQLEEALTREQQMLGDPLLGHTFLKEEL
jgi:arylsulfatase A-like enzyme